MTIFFIQYLRYIILNISDHRGSIVIMNVITLFITHYPITLMVIVGLLGLCVGSFLNVVIYRLPRMLLYDWYQQARALMQACPTPPDFHDATLRFHQLAMDDTDLNEKKPFNLFFPRSHCPQCQHSLSWWNNIPLISFLFLRGRCHFCQYPISWRYPLIEALSGILALIVLWQLGPTWNGFAGIVLTWFLLAMTVIDLDHQLIPDDLTLPLLWLGLFVNLFSVFTTLDHAVIGAIAGYVSLWTIAQLFQLVTGREGMGYGDFKLVSVFGAWFGWTALLMIILIASFLGAIVGITIHFLGKHKRSIPLPFGPYLALAAWISLCWGDWIMQWYLHLAFMR